MRSATGMGMMTPGTHRVVAAGTKGMDRRHSPVRVFLVDEAPARGLGRTIKVPPDRDLTVVGEAGTVAAAAAGVAARKPDVVVLGPHVGVKEAGDVSSTLRAACPDVPMLLVMEPRGEPHALPTLLDAGIHGQVLADVGDEILSLAIRTVAAGASFLCPRLTRLGASPRRSRADERTVLLDSLSPQQRRILPILAEGKTNREIALALRLSEKTVKNYLANMFEKLHVTRRTQAIALYLRTRAGTGSLRRLG